MIRFSLVATLCVCCVCFEGRHSLTAQTPLEARLEYLYMRQHPEAKTKTKPVSKTTLERLDSLPSKRSPEARREYLRRLREKQSAQPQAPVTSLPETKIPESGPKPKAQPESGTALLPMPQAAPERSVTSKSPGEKTQPEMTTLEPFSKKERDQLLLKFDLPSLRNFDTANCVEVVPVSLLIQDHIQLLLAKKGERDIDYITIKYAWNNASRYSNKEETKEILSLLSNLQEWNLGEATKRLSVLDSLTEEAHRLYQADPQSVDAEFFRAQYQLNEAEREAVKAGNLRVYTKIGRIRKGSSFTPTYRDLLDTYLKQSKPEVTIAEKNEFYNAIKLDGSGAGFVLSQNKGWNVPAPIIYGLHHDFTAQNEY